MIDLISMKAIVFYNDEATVTRFESEEIPANLREEADEWRGKLVEAVAEVDDTLLQRYLDDHESITPAELATALRKATVTGLAIPVICGSAFKIRECRTFSMQLLHIFHLQLIRVL